VTSSLFKQLKGGYGFSGWTRFAELVADNLVGADVDAFDPARLQGHENNNSHPWEPDHPQNRRPSTIAVRVITPNTIMLPDAVLRCNMGARGRTTKPRDHGPGADNCVIQGRLLGVVRPRLGSPLSALAL